jgi:ATP-binding cassette, subfamily F, member 3
MITGKNIIKTFIGDPVIDGLDFVMGNNHKIGIVGKNGCGKTTFLKLIIGEEELTLGNIDFESERVGYLPQEFSFPDLMVGEYLENLLDESWEIYKVELLLSQLKFENYDPYQDIKTLSEGQKMKLKMIEILLEDPTILLIDEPTNHLDIEGIMWFEKYIKHLPKTVVMISHDREFLNNTVDEIWEIENKKLIRFAGNYDFYREEKLKLIDKWDQEYIQFLKKKSQLEKLLENVHKIKDGKKRGRAVSSAKKRIEREVTSNTKEKYESKKMAGVNFDTELSKHKLVIKFAKASKYFGTKKVFENLSFDVYGKERVWLFGPNGAGKSTLVKIIQDIESLTSGNVFVGPKIRIGYFAQRADQLDPSKNLLEFFLEATSCEYGKAFGYLKKFLFTKDDLPKLIRQLSPGQRARYAFAIFAYNNYDLLILDEPTNHLDIETTEVIEDSLRNFEGTLFLISHDRFFVERVGITKILNLKAGKLSEV